jgi:hypothetical protein
MFTYESSKEFRQILIFILQIDINELKHILSAVRLTAAVKSVSQSARTRKFLSSNLAALLLAIRVVGGACRLF